MKFFCELLKNDAVNLDQNTIRAPSRDWGTVTSASSYNRPLTPTKADLCLYWVLYRYSKWLNTPKKRRKKKRLFMLVAIHIPFPLIPKGLPSRFMYVSKNVKLLHKLHHFLHSRGHHKETCSQWRCSYFYDLRQFHFQQLIMPAHSHSPVVSGLHFLLINDAKSFTAKQRPVRHMPSFSPSSHTLPHIQSLFSSPLRSSRSGWLYCSC